MGGTLFKQKKFMNDSKKSLKKKELEKGSLIRKGQVTILCWAP